MYFGLMILVIIGVFASVNFNLKKEMLHPENFCFSDSTSILMIGDSEIGFSLNPEFIPHSNNQSIIGEHYLYTYTRLKLFLENNPQLESVLLGFSYLNIFKKSDMRLTNNPREQSWYFSKEFMLLDKDELKCLYSLDILFLRNYLAWEWGFPTKENVALIWKSFWGNFNQESMPYMGFFIDGGTVSNPDNAKERIAGTMGNEFEYEIASIQMEYLYRMIDLCRTHKIKLFLFSSPLSKNYYDLIPEFYISGFEKIKKELPKDVSFMDYTRYPLPDSCFFDSNHLNRLGAEIISRKVAGELASFRW